MSEDKGPNPEVEKHFKKVEEVPISIMEGRYYHCIFYMPFPPGESHILGGNLMGCLWRLDDEPQSWRMTYRFRYYKTMAVQDSNDEKSWYVLHVYDPDGPKKLMEMITLMAVGRKACFGDTECNEPDEVDVLMIEGDNGKFMVEAMKQKKPWFNIGKQITGEQAKELAKQFGLEKEGA